MSPVGTPSGTSTDSWTATYTPTMSQTATRSYTGSATITPTMTILNAQALPAPSNTIAIAGIVSGAGVVGILGIAAMILMLRRPSRSPATPLVFHEEVPVVKNPGFERDRSMSYPPTPEFDYMGRPYPITAQKNPFAAKTTSVRFNPVPVRNTMTSFNIPPPPPPPLDI